MAKDETLHYPPISQYCCQLLQLAKLRCARFSKLTAQSIEPKTNQADAKCICNSRPICICAGGAVPDDRRHHMVILVTAVVRVESGQLEETKMLISEAKSLFWDALHTGSWHNATSADREGYAAAGLLDTYVCMFAAKKVTYQTFKCLDMVLLLSGDDSENLLTSTVQSMHDKWWDNLQSTMCDVSEDVNQPNNKRFKPSPIISPFTHRLDPLKRVKRIERPSLAWFAGNAMEANVPVIVTGAMNHWPSLCRDTTQWSNFKYLESVAGARTVPVEFGANYMDDEWSQQLMTFSAFIRKYVDSTSSGIGYLAQHKLLDQIPALARDIATPDYCTLSQNTQEDLDINIWIGPEGTVSNLHFDLKHNLLCQVVGTKYIRLYHSKYSEYLYPHDGVMSNTSKVDVLGNPAEHEERFQRFQQAQYTECVLNPGEIIGITFDHWIKVYRYHFGGNDQ